MCIHVMDIVKILNLYIILLCAHLYHFLPVSIHYLQCINFLLHYMLRNKCGRHLSKTYRLELSFFNGYVENVNISCSLHPYMFFICNVARMFEQKVAKFKKTPKNLHQSTFENPKYLHRRSSKRPNYLYQSTKRKSQNRFKTGLKPVFSHIFK